MNLEYVSEAGRDITEAERESIENSIGIIASTPYGSAPFTRNMGIRNYPPKNDSELARNQYAAEVITQCGIWEDRARLRQVTVNGEGEARMVIEYGKR